jgi:hypothetical protein
VPYITTNDGVEIFYKNLGPARRPARRPLPQIWDGNDMDHYADDLAAVIEAQRAYGGRIFSPS